MSILWNYTRKVDGKDVFIQHIDPLQITNNISYIKIIAKEVVGIQNENNQINETILSLKFDIQRQISINNNLILTNLALDTKINQLNILSTKNFNDIQIIILLHLLSLFIILIIYFN